jgi:hypothetical protein
MAESFDAQAYGRVPQLNSALTVSLGRRLIVEMPQAIVEEPSALVAANRMRDGTAVLRVEHLKTLDRSKSTDTRPFDQGEDDAWGALHARLASYAEIDSDEGRRAAALVNRLFPEGLGFLALSFKEQWEASDVKLALIDKEELAPQLDELCGDPIFLAQLRTAHQVYGDALGLTKAKPEQAEAPEIAEALRSLRAAIRFYSRRVVALADEQDPASVALVQKALAPILEAQQDARTRRSKGQPDPNPPDEGEVPPLPNP